MVLAPRSVAVVLGTRPEAVKLAVLVELLGDAAWVIATGQHYDADLWTSVLGDLGFPAPHDALAVGGTSRAAQLGRGTEALGDLFAARPPACVVVQGDTNASAAGALAGNACDVPIVHVEAGLRSHDRAMPEEHNRVLVDHLAERCLAPTDVAAANLAAEGITGDRVVVTGNTVVEAVLRMCPEPAARAVVRAEHGLDAGAYAVATIHRPENVDRPEPYAAILGELAELPIPVLLPLHPRSRARAEALGLGPLLTGGSIRVVAPLPPVPFLALAADAALWVSDSGGLQEEASVLKRPVIVVRNSTERPEVQGTFATLVPPGPRIGDEARRLLEDLPAVHARLAGIPSPYGDGSASHRSLDALLDLVTSGR
jgi:UDP-N-acetylglucosamine 2-epimerase (non-hydrolysing)